MSTLIAGCGYVGQELGRRLHSGGEQVWGLTLGTSELPDGIEPLVADLRDPDSLATLPAVDRVVFAASPSKYDEASYRATYISGLTNLLTALQAHASPPSRLVFCSSMGVYAQQDGSWVDEGSETTNEKYNGLVMLECERLVQESPIPSVSVRIAGIYGTERCRVVRDVRAGRAKTSAGASVFTNLVHRDDCAGLLHHLLDLQDPAPIYVGVDDEPLERDDLLRWLAAHMGVAPPSEGDGSGTSPWLRQRPGDRGKRLSNKLLKESGYTFEYPTFREGYAQVVSALGDK
jgi:nucleoside-diphosphate-sugar epimerase